MVNIYNKGGYKNPSIPKPSGGYSSTVKPATAPMRQGGLSQLAAKAAMQGRQPAAGNPPIPQTGRVMSQPKAVESAPPGATPPPQPKPQYGQFGAVSPKIDPSTPVQSGMLGAITQGIRAPQGQARGMAGAAAEAATPQVPGWLTPELAGAAGGALQPPPGYIAGAEDAVDGEPGPTYKGKAATPGAGQPGGGKYKAVPTSLFSQPGLAEAAAALGGMDLEKMAQKKELVDGGMSPYLADIIMDLASGEYGYSDEEKAKMIAKGAGQQAEMMAARGLGASGLAGTGFGDIYSKVMSDAADLESAERLKSQQLLAGILSQEQAAEVASKEADDAKLMEWALAAPGDATSVSANAYKQYQKWKDAGYSDADIRGAGTVHGGVWYLGDPPATGTVGDLPSNLFEAHPPPTQGDPSGQGADGAEWDAYYSKIGAKYGVPRHKVREHVQALLAAQGIQSAGSAAAGSFEE